MKLWKKILIVVSIILCVGLLGASIARTAVKPVTVNRPGSGSSASTPAATEPSEPEIQYVNDGKIYILVTTKDYEGYAPVVYEDYQVVQPVSVRSITRANVGGDDDDDSEEFNVYRVTPGSSLIRFEDGSAESEAKTGDLRGWDPSYCCYKFTSSGRIYDDITGHPTSLACTEIQITLDTIFLMIERR
ncbi:MAG: hypothetical protein J5958_05515 [Clostridia bacterium]|nr:hypothetical protein [Clostridia bacterium]